MATHFLTHHITPRPQPPPACTHTLKILAKRHTHDPNPSTPNPNHLKTPSRHHHITKPKPHHYSTLSPPLDPPPPLSSLPPSHSLGFVAASQANFMRVIVTREPNSSGIELLCQVKTVLKKIKRRVLVGDRVLVGSIDWKMRSGVIENVYVRDTEVGFPPVANVDHFLVVFSLDQPRPEPYSLTRFLVEAESVGVPVSLAFNKAELVGDEVLAAWKSRLHNWGYQPIFCSVESKQGLDSLAFALRDRTTVIVGPSGVGKSSLINVLRSSEKSLVGVDESSLFDPIAGSKWFEEQAVGEVSAKYGKGKHTTRNVSFLPLAGGGYLADTPGFSQPSLLKVTKRSLALAFPEIRKVLEENAPQRCAFGNCLHIGEPGCLIGGDWERLPYYLQLLDEVKVREEYQLRTYGTKRESDVKIKVGEKGVAREEPRLEMKKHRRESRKTTKQSILKELEGRYD